MLEWFPIFIPLEVKSFLCLYWFNVESSFILGAIRLVWDQDNWYFLREVDCIRGSQDWDLQVYCQKQDPVALGAAARLWMICIIHESWWRLLHLNDWHASWRQDCISTAPASIAGLPFLFGSSQLLHESSRNGEGKTDEMWFYVSIPLHTSHESPEMTAPRDI